MVLQGGPLIVVGPAPHIEVQNIDVETPFPREDTNRRINFLSYLRCSTWVYTPKGKSVGEGRFIVVIL